jgi:hypothetical protein
VILQDVVTRASLLVADLARVEAVL